MMTLQVKLIIFLPLIQLAWTKCNLKAINETSYTLPLWGKRITRHCKPYQVFSPGSCGCRTQKASEELYKGRRLSNWEAPWTLSLTFKCYVGVRLDYIPNVRQWTHDEFFCTAVLIHRRWALTAKHCMVGNHCNSRKITSAWAGGTDRLRHQTRRATVLWSKDVQTGGIPDLAVLFLSEGMNENPIAPMVQPDADYMGKKSPDKADGYMHGADVILQRCELTDWTDRRWAICTTNTDGTLMCAGDSGGPLLCKDAKGQYRTVGVGSESIRGCGTKHKDHAQESMYASVQGVRWWWIFHLTGDYMKKHGITV